MNIDKNTSNTLVMAMGKEREPERAQAGKYYNHDGDSAQEVLDAERDGLVGQQPNLFIHPDDLKDWKKFLAKKKKDKQVQYSETIRSRMMRQQQKQPHKAAGSPPSNQHTNDSFVNKGSPRSKKQKRTAEDKNSSVGTQGDTQKKGYPQITVHSYQNDKKFYQGRSMKVEGLPSLSNERKLNASIKEDASHVMANSDSFGAPEAANDSARQQSRVPPDAAERAPETLPSTQRGQAPREEEESKANANNMAKSPIQIIEQQDRQEQQLTI